MSWRWVSKTALCMLHDESLALHGGASGVRDFGMLDSALNRPVNLAINGEPDAAELAAAYAFGLAKNHAFVDGNKRAALLAAGLFLHINNYRLLATQVDATHAVLALAAGDLNEAQFAQWLRVHMAPRNAVHQTRAEYGK